MSEEDFSLDHALIRRRFSRLADSVRANDFVAREISSRMAERLDYIRLSPKRVLDLGCGHGADQAMLAQRYPQALHLALDQAQPALLLAKPRRSLLKRMLGREEGPRLLCADAEQLPLARGSIDFVWSNLLLNWLSDPAHALKEAHRVLAVDGLLMFSTLGPDTLRELRDALPGPLGARVHRFIDMHDIGDCLVKAGFSDPVMDMQTITLTYPDSRSLFAELRATASASASSSRPRGLTGRRAWQQACARLDALRERGRIPATLEVVFGHAWKPAPKTTDDGRAIIRFRSRPA